MPAAVPFTNPASPYYAQFQSLTEQQKQTVAAFDVVLYDPTKLDVQSEPLYDTITKTAGQTITVGNAPSADGFFTNISGSGKGLNQTNLTTSLTLQAPEAFSIWAFRFGWSEDILRADLTAILNNTALQFYIGNKAYNTAPLRHYTSGFGISGFTSQTNESFYTNGVPNRDAMAKLQVKLVIESNTQFKGVLQGSNTVLTNTTGSVGAILILELDGLHARGVQ